MRVLPTLLSLLLLTACGRGPLDPLTSLGEGDSGTSSARDSGMRPRDGGPGGIRDGGPGGIRDGGPGGVRDGGPMTPRDGGAPAQCRTDQDCFRQLGRPICPQGQPGDWLCARGACELLCDTPPECRNDCDCPPELACGNGECRPLNRNNRCCFSPTCLPGEECVLPNGGTSICEGPPPPPDAGVRDGGPGPMSDGGLPPDAGVTPVGDACMTNAMCPPIGFCIEAQNGFPDGYCSQDCGRGGQMCPSGAQCRNFGPGQQLCLDECMSPNECRMGYSCVQLGINPQRVCWPTIPGSTNPNGDPVGASCNNDQNCAQGLTCLQFQGWPGGYCTRQYCDPQNNPCPSGSACYAFPGLQSLCLAGCPSGGSQSTCRAGYYCLGPTGQPGGCIPN